jgi:acyl transferase domain-containing protein
VLADLPATIRLATRPVDLAEHAGPLHAGVSAFGLTGTNVHVVLAEAPRVAPPRRRRHRAAPWVLPLSGKNPAAVRDLAGRYADLVASRVRAADLTDVCHSAAAHRSHHADRIAVVADSRDALLDGLRSAQAGYDSPAVLSGHATEAPRVVFVFAGQGSQRAGMARELLAREPLFLEWMRRCDKEIAAEVGWSVIDRLRGDEPLTAEEHIQPALWAIEVSLAALWRAWGIEPDLLIGHSMGEIAAAVTSGALSIRDGARLICRRSAMLTRVEGSGAMWAVQLGEAEATEAIADVADRVCVAAVNSDHSTTLSGAGDAVAAVVEKLRGRGVYCKQLRVGCASHAPQVEPIAADLRAALADQRTGATRIPLYTTLFERDLDGPALDSEYWVANLRQPVRFAPAVRAALAGSPGNTLFIEVSTHAVLVPAIEDLLESTGGAALAVASMCRDQSEQDTLLTALATAYTQGCQPEWRRVYPDARFVPVPGYQWQRRSFWADTPNGGRRTVVPPAPAPVRVKSVVDSSGDLVRTIVMHTADVLALPQDEIDPSAPLLDAGLDSLLAAKLGIRIKQDLGVQVPVRQLLARLSLEDLAAQLGDQLPAGQTS